MRTASFLLVISCLATFALSAQAAVLPLAGQQEPAPLETLIVTTSVDEVRYNEKGQTAEPQDMRRLRRSLAENLKIRLRRGYTIPLEVAEALPIERTNIVRPYDEISQALFVNNSTPTPLVDIDSSARLRASTQPLAASATPLWLAVVPSAVTNSATGQVETALVVVFGPTVAENGLLATIAGNSLLLGTVSANSIEAPITSDLSSTNGNFPTFTQTDVLTTTASDLERQVLLQDARDPAEEPHGDGRSEAAIAAVPEPSTWVMMLFGSILLALLNGASRIGRNRMPGGLILGISPN